MAGDTWLGPPMWEGASPKVSIVEEEDEAAAKAGSGSVLGSRPFGLAMDGA